VQKKSISYSVTTCGASGDRREALPKSKKGTKGFRDVAVIKNISTEEEKGLFSTRGKGKGLERVIGKNLRVSSPEKLTENIKSQEGEKKQALWSEP